jgi:DNA-binding transcriptional MocR family regulator
MSPSQRKAEYDSCLAQYKNFQSQKLTINMSRGKPHAEQLAFSHEMLTAFSRGFTAEGGFLAEDGTDCRNYGGLYGIPEMKRLFAEILDVDPSSVTVGGNSSLNMMFDCVAAFRERIWDKKIKFICPVPGYDRHFAMCEYFDIEMIPVEMTEAGPDMDAVERLAADPSVAGMWCVPVFSNPQGYTYSDETVGRLAAMPAANPHFRLFWDNAYAVHHFRGERPRLLNIFAECARPENNRADRPLAFTSFSKISFAGSAVAAVAASPRNLSILRNRLKFQTVGPDKINQLTHARYFKNLSGVLAHMEKLADILRPKFETAEDIFTRRLGGTGIADWYTPDGGYFISFNTLDHCAKRTVALCAEAGVETTGAGATYPYGNDPRDRNIRIAPSYLTAGELRAALEVFCCAVRLAALELLNGEAYHA